MWYSYVKMTLALILEIENKQLDYSGYIIENVC